MAAENPDFGIGLDEWLLSIVWVGNSCLAAGPLAGSRQLIWEAESLFRMPQTATLWTWRGAAHGEIRVPQGIEASVAAIDPAVLRTLHRHKSTAVIWNSLQETLACGRETFSLLRLSHYVATSSCRISCKYPWPPHLTWLPPPNKWLNVLGEFFLV